MESDDDFQDPDAVRHPTPHHPPGRKTEPPGQRCVVPSCKYVGVGVRALRSHMASKHPKARKCRICDIMVPSLKLLREHMKGCHAGDSRFSCDRCSYVGTNSQSLHNHKAQDHDAVKEHPKLVCRETDRSSDGSVAPACTTVLKRVADLRNHLADHHGITAARHEVTLQLESLDDFNRWKSVFEEESSAKYNARNGKLKERGTATYVCSRSGHYAPTVENRKRHTKSQGTCKLGFACTATIRVKTTADGQVSVTVNPFHYGHGTDMTNLPHLRLPTATKAYAQERLLKGVSLSRIIRDVRQSKEDAGDPGTSRGYWLTRRDLLNMCYDLNISAQGTAFHKDRNEVRSVEMYAEEIRSSDQQHLLALTPEAASPSGTEYADEAAGMVSAPPAPRITLVTPPVSRPGGKASAQVVIRKVQEVMLMAQNIQDTISAITCQGILSHLAKIEQMLVLEGNSRADSTTLPVASDVRPSTAHIDPQPAFTCKRRQRAAPAGVVKRAQGSDARQAVLDLVAGDVGREKRPRFHEDHSYCVTV